MKNMTLRLMADACGGILHLAKGREYLADTEILDITTDSRKAAQGSLFCAIVGEHMDGHDFIPKAFEQGAYCVLTERDLPQDSGNYIRVLSTLQAIKDLGEYYLKQMNIPVVGITGSVGKTSTKEMIASILEQKYRVLKTAGNFNNELGLPLTIFRLRQEDEIAVLEMGISDFGEMHRLAKVARPQTCVITNIGTCHLENLGDRDGVLRAKSEIFDFLPEDGHIVLNGNDDRLVRLKQVRGVEPVFFGLPDRKADENLSLSVYADTVEPLGLKGTECTIHTPAGSFRTRIPKPGDHMILNALAGTAVGLLYGLNLQQIDRGIRSLPSMEGRFRIINTDEYTLIDDCYNANPMSMKAGIQALAQADGDGRRIAILGDMKELGENERLYHREIGTYASNAGIDVLIAIGPLAKDIADAAGEEGSVIVSWYETLEELLPGVKKMIGRGDTVLIKASHSMHFERILDTLLPQ